MIETYYNKDGIIVRDSEERDVRDIENILNKEFVLNGKGSHDRNNHPPIMDSFNKSTRSFIITDNDIPVAIFGIVPNPVVGEKDCLWVKYSTEIKKKYKTIMKIFKERLRMVMVSHPILFNIIEKKHRSTIRMIKFCGAIIEEYDNEKIMYVLRRDKVCAS